MTTTDDAIADPATKDPSLSSQVGGTVLCPGPVMFPMASGAEADRWTQEFGYPLESQTGGISLGGMMDEVRSADSAGRFMLEVYDQIVAQKGGEGSETAAAFLSNFMPPMPQSTGTGTAALDRTGWQKDLGKGFATGTGHAGTDDPVHDEPAGNVFQLFGHILAEAAQRPTAMGTVPVAGGQLDLLARDVVGDGTTLRLVLLFLIRQAQLCSHLCNRDLGCLERQLKLFCRLRGRAEPVMISISDISTRLGIRLGLQCYAQISDRNGGQFTFVVFGRRLLLTSRGHRFVMFFPAFNNRRKAHVESYNDFGGRLLAASFNTNLCDGWLAYRAAAT